jgi:translation initiation factor 3 subunit E
MHTHPPTHPRQSGNQDKILSAQWGKLAADTLDGNWDACLEDVVSLSHLIEARALPHRIALQQRACLIHWSLFAFFHAPANKGLEAMVDLCLDPLYVITIQVVCPWILSPLAVAVLLSKRKGALKEYVRVTYQDPAPVPLLVSFLRTLSGQASDDVVSTDGTIALFKQCLAQVRADRFMGLVAEAFVQRVHAMLFESYVKLYHVIHIPTVVAMLELAEGEDGERWIVDMLQSLKLDATINEVEVGLWAV